MKEKTEILEQYDFIQDSSIEKHLKNYAPAIGKFLVRFSYLDYVLDLAIAEIINDRGHQPGYAVIKNLSSHQKMELFL